MAPVKSFCAQLLPLQLPYTTQKQHTRERKRNIARLCPRYPLVSYLLHVMKRYVILIILPQCNPCYISPGLSEDKAVKFDVVGGIEQAWQMLRDHTENTSGSVRNVSGARIPEKGRH